jgi:hypothetical protein
VVGRQTCTGITSQDENVCIGYRSGRYAAAEDNTIIGSYAAGGNPMTGTLNAIYGHSAGRSLTSGSRNVLLGYSAGYRLTTESDMLIIDNRDQTTAAAELTDALIVGNFHATPTSQRLLVNADLVTSGSYNFAADAEASDTYVITLDPVPNGYRTGMMITFTANTANTDGVTLNVNGLGAKAILKMHDQPLVTGDIEAGQVVVVVYDGTQFQMTSQLAQ